MRTQTRSGLATTLIAWALISAGIFVHSAGLPFFTDNTETYSDFIHARNLYNHGWKSTYGLSDETYGSSLNASRVVYTHQGNLPRLYAYFLYASGIRSVKGQIIATWATVGTAVIIMGFFSLELIGGAFFGALGMLCILSNYLFFVQWQFDTFRVWHGFFIFLTILLSLSKRKKNSSFLDALIFIDLFGSFYMEIAFGVFIFLLFCTLSVSTKLKGTPLIRKLAVATLGTCAGATTLALQVIAYLGWPNFIKDLRYTFIERNYSSALKASSTGMENFYSSQGILFWYDNKIDGSVFKTVSKFFSFTLRYLVSTMQPALICAVTLLILALLGRWLIVTAEEKLPKQRKIISNTLQFRKAWILGSFVAVTVALAVLLIAVHRLIMPDARLQYDHPVRFYLYIQLLAIPLLLSAVKLATGKWMGFGNVAPVRKIVLFFVLVATYSFVRQRFLFVNSPDPELEGLPKLLRILGGGAPGLKFALNIYISWLAMIILFRKKRLPIEFMPNKQRVPVIVLPFCLFAAYAMVYRLFPGYIISAYLWRWSLFPSICILVGVGYSFYVLVFASITFLYRYAFLERKWRQIKAAKIRGFGVRYLGELSTGALAIISVLSTLFFGKLYASDQLTYYRAFPPNRFAFLPKLGKPPYAGSSFASTNDTVTISSYTNAWSYYDPKFGSFALGLTEDGFHLDRDLRHLWSSDRNSNAKYLKPNYFICMASGTPVYSSALRSLEGATYDCSLEPIAIRAEMGSAEGLQPKIVDRDMKNDLWMIVKMDWDYPPYLAVTSGGPVRVALVKSRTSVLVQYHYKQEDDLTEKNSVIRLYRILANSAELKNYVRPAIRQLIREQTSDRYLTLPKDNWLYQVSVTPATATKRGAEYFSQPFEIHRNGTTITLASLTADKTPVGFYNAYGKQAGSHLTLTWLPVLFANWYRVQLTPKRGTIKVLRFDAPVTLFEETIQSDSGPWTAQITACDKNWCEEPSKPINILSYSEERND